jgi:hypothetical protein
VGGQVRRETDCVRLEPQLSNREDELKAASRESEAADRDTWPGPLGFASGPFLIQSGREIRTVDEWLEFAGPKEGEKQWAHGYSAMECARVWLRSGRPAVPREIALLLESAEQTSSFWPFYAIPEMVTRLDEFGGEHRNHDLIAVGVARGGPTLVAVEAKAREQFGPIVGTHFESATKKPGSNIPGRIRRLVRSLFGPDALAGDQIASPYASLRYQLLTGLAGTLIEARRRFVGQAVFVVHEFTSLSGPPGGYVGTSRTVLARNAEDWAAFLRALGASPEVEDFQLVGPLFAPGGALVPADVPFFLGKVTRDLGEDAALRWAADRSKAGFAASASTSQTTHLDAAQLRAEGFAGFVGFEELRSGELKNVPHTAGVYVVVREGEERPGFLDASSGGRFKGKDPTELVDVLESKWVEGAEVVYIGKGEDLRRRLKQYTDFGAGHPVGHWGGRYIWQLADADRLVVGWRACEQGETASEAEARLLRQFKEAFGCLPFANIADPSR